LILAASQNDLDGVPQAFCACLKALISIDKNHPAILALIRQFHHICNWGLIRTSLEALAAIETAESRRTMEEIRDRWYSEFSKTQKQLVDELVDVSRE
jgi:hypothetical protein